MAYHSLYLNIGSSSFTCEGQVIINITYIKRDQRRYNAKTVTGLYYVLIIQGQSIVVNTMIIIKNTMLILYLSAAQWHAYENLTIIVFIINTLLMYICN